MINIDVLEINYFQNGLPVPYKLKKGKDILIYPIIVKDYPMYEWCKSLLEIDKNTINDINIIQMTDLEFLINVVFKQDEQNVSLFVTLFELCLKKHITYSKDKGKDCLIVYNDNNEIESVINSKEFKDIKEIILFQNDKDYDNRYVNPDVKEEYEKYVKLKHKESHCPTLEEQKTYVMSKTGYSIFEINDMIYRMFAQIFNHSLNSEVYLTQKIIQASFKYDVKEDVIHPLFEKKVDKYQEMFKDAESFENKIQQVNG